MADDAFGWRCGVCGAVSHILAEDEVVGPGDAAHMSKLYKPELSKIESGTVISPCKCKWRLGRARKSKCRIEEAERRIGKLRDLITELRARCPHEDLRTEERTYIPGGTQSEKICSICGESCGIQE